MRAILLAAGRGMRLQRSAAEHMPKCLLRFGGASLLERHVRLLKEAGVDEIVIAVGFKSEQIEDELRRLGARVEVLLNPDYELGSVLTVHTTADALTRGGDVLLMDADVLYDDRMVDALVAGVHADRLLIDRAFMPGDEPVKVCLKDGIVVEFRKQVRAGLEYDTIGESVGFFRFTQETARRLAQIVKACVDDGRAHLPHEEAIRELLLGGGPPFEITDVTGSPWIEIDYPDDIVRAGDEVLPRLQRLAGAPA